MDAHIHSHHGNILLLACARASMDRNYQRILDLRHFRETGTSDPATYWNASYFPTRSQINVFSTTGAVTSVGSIRNDIRLLPWNVYQRLVDLPTAFGV